MSKLNSYILALFTILVFVLFIIMRQTTDFSFAQYKEFQSQIITGMFNTILVSFITLIGSMIFGFIFYLMSIARNKYLNALTDVFTEITYGTPLLVLIIISAYLIGPAFEVFNVNLMGMIALVVYMTPYMKNVYKSGISSIPDEQYMAMDLFGFTSFQRYRYIIIPQVVRILMPPLMNNFSMIIKGSALLYVLAFNELYFSIIVAQSKTYAFVQGYVLLWVLYLTLTIPLSLFTKYIERKWSL